MEVKRCGKGLDFVDLEAWNPLEVARVVGSCDGGVAGEIVRVGDLLHVRRLLLIQADFRFGEEVEDHEFFVAPLLGDAAFVFGAFQE